LYLVFPLAFLLKLCFFQHVNELNLCRLCSYPGNRTRSLLRFTIDDSRFTIYDLWFSHYTVIALRKPPCNPASRLSFSFDLKINWFENLKMICSQLL